MQRGHEILRETEGEFRRIIADDAVRAELGELFARPGLHRFSLEIDLPHPGCQPDIQTRTVDMTIANLRQKIERDASTPKIITTVKGVGYKFNIHG